MNVIATQLFLLFAYIGIGFTCHKIKLFDEKSDKYFSAFLLKVSLPATIIASAIGQEADNRAESFYIIALATGIFIFLPLLANIYQRLTKSSDTFKLMLTYSNLGFMGMPIMDALYGEIGMFYASLFMAVFNISVFSYGVSVIQKTKKLDLKKMLSPGIVAAVLALVIFTFNIALPNPITLVLRGVGSITTPLAMIILGSTIGGINLISVFKDKSLYLFTFCKIILWPFIVWFILQFFVDSKMILGVCTILISLPVAGNVTMLSLTYGGDVDVAVRGTCLSTLLSLLTIPVYMFLFML